MKNLAEMMKQAQAMQGRINEMQERLAGTEVSGSSGAGMVTVTLNGKGEMTRVSIDPALMAPDEAEVAEDLIVAAHRDAKAKLDAYLAEEMGKVTGGLDLPPGLKLPF